MKELIKALGLHQINGYSYVQPVSGGKASATLLYQKMENEEKVIVKMLIAPRNDTELQNFRHEAEALSQVRRFVPKLIIAFRHHDPYPVYYYVMEFIDGITLEQYIKENPFPWPWKESIDMLYRISFALSAFSADFIHRDLHPANILLLDNIEFDEQRLVYEDPGIRILDFGCNKNFLEELLGKWDEDEYRHFGALSSWSPEFIDNPKTVLQNHDSWALGVMLYRFLTGDYPIHVQCFGDLITAFKDEQNLIKKIEGLDIPLALKSLLKNLLSFNPAGRFLTGPIGDMCVHLLYNNLVDKTKADEGFLKKYMAFGASIHQCVKCSEFVGRWHAKCPACGNILDIESCLPVL